MPTKATLLKIIDVQTEVARLGADLGAVMRFVTENAADDLTQADGAMIELADGDEMVCRAAAGCALSSLGMRIPRSGSLSGRCVALSVPLRCNECDINHCVDHVACCAAGARSMLAVPLKHADMVVGVLKIFSRRPRAFHKTDADVLGLLSGLVAASMFYAARYDMDALYYRATHDEMTDMANRSLFLDRLHTEIADCRRYAQMAGIVIIDMDELKQINDTFGHAAGDAAIIECGRRIKSVCRRSDTAARLGGDEFGIVLGALDPEKGALPTIERLEAEFARPFTCDDHPLALCVSIGVAIFPGDGRGASELLSVADSRMYEMKRQHRMPVR